MVTPCFWLLSYFERFLTQIAEGLSYLMVQFQKEIPLFTIPKIVYNEVPFISQINKVTYLPVSPLALTPLN